MRRMEAWQWTGTGRPIERRRVPILNPGPGEVRIRVRAAGLCHSDIGELDDPSFAKNIAMNPITLGHEIAGSVDSLGEGVAKEWLGCRVGVYPLGKSVPGYSRDGGFAQFTLAPVTDLIVIPDNLGYELGAIGTDAGMTSHHAIVARARVAEGDRVGLIGLGGVGQFGASIAVQLGAEVHVADPRPDRGRIGERLGVHAVYASASDLEGLGLDSVIDFAGAERTTDSAVRAVRSGGRIVLVGLGAERMSLNVGDVIHQKVSIVGSSGGGMDDIDAVYRLMASEAIVPDVEPVRFGEIDRAIGRLRDGRVRGRLVAVGASGCTQEGRGE